MGGERKESCGCRFMLPLSLTQEQPWSAWPNRRRGQFFPIISSWRIMARPWKAPQLLLAILVALVAFSYQQKRKTFISVLKISPLDSSAQSTLKYVTEEYNKKSDDLYNFRIIRILDIESQVSVCGFPVSPPQRDPVKSQVFVLILSYCPD